MSCTVRAALAGSSWSSQPCGLPVSTAQKRQARVQTSPISISVAVPAFQHSPMLGHLASSQTVARRCSRTVWRTVSKRWPAGIGARSHDGLRPAGSGAALAVALMPSLIAVMPCGVTYFWPLRAALGTTGMPLNSLMAGPLGGGALYFLRATAASIDVALALRTRIGTAMRRPPRFARLLALGGSPR